MAKRKGLSAGLGSAAASMSGLVDAYIRQAVQEASQTRQNEFITGRQRELAQLTDQLERGRMDITHRNALSERLLTNPDAADRAAQSGGALDGVDLAPYRPTSGQRQKPSIDAILNGNTPQNRIGPAALAALAGLAGIQGGVPPELTAMMAERAGNIETEEVNKENALPRIGPGGVSGRYGRNGGPFMPTERTGEQQGLFDLDQFQHGEGSPAYAITKADAENMLSKLTLGQRSTDARSIAQATEQGQENVRISDSTIAGEGKRAEAIARAGAQGTAGMTQSERMATASVVPLVAANARAMESEKSGAFLDPISIAKAGSPTAAWVLGMADSVPLVNMMTKVNSRTAGYAQSAMDFANNIGKILSGTTVRPDERANFLSTYFTVKNDSPVVAKQKLDSRQVFVAAAMASAGRNKKEVGTIIGRGILQGTLPLATLQIMEFDPEVNLGINAILNGGGPQ